MAECEHIASGQFPAPGVPGATFVPGVEEIPEGYEVSWENNRNLPNPDPVRLLHGKSAYQLAVEAGYEGTEVEFAAEMADAAVAKAKAEAAAEAAGKSETNAAGSASAAAQSEQNAKDSEEAARQAAAEAAQLAQAAAGSAGAASLSEQNAAASEQAAEDAAEEAGNRATAAGNAAGAAARSEANAKTSEENAARSEEEAKKAAQEAQGVILSGPAQPGQLLLVESVSEDGKLLKCTAVDRTHSEGEPVVTEVLPEQSMDFSNKQVALPIIGLVAGTTYIVTFDGTEYECVGAEKTMDGITATYIGNPVFFGETDNGLPFIVGDIPAQDTAIVMVATAGTYTVGIKTVTENLKKLDSKYLDLNWIPTKTWLTGQILEETTANGYGKPVPGLYAKMLDEGAKITVTFDGVEYACTVKRITSVYGNFKYVGNLALTNWSDAVDTGEPFGMREKYYSNSGAMELSTEDRADHTISIYGEYLKYSTVPPEYMPEAYTMPTDWGTLTTGVSISEAYHAMTAILEGRPAFALYNGVAGPVIGAYSDGSDFAYVYAIFESTIRKVSRYFPGFFRTAVPIVPEGKSSYDLALPAPNSGAVGQILRVREVHESLNVPVATEAVDPEELLVLTSPNGTKYKLIVADDGTLSTEAVTT